MSNDHDHPIDRVPSDLLVQMGYETRDVTPAAILRWIIVLFVFIAVVSAAIMALENFFVPQTGQIAYDSTVFGSAPIRHEPPQPQLQTNPKRDIIMYRQDEKRQLDGYNATPKGNVSIPVNDAIDQMAAEGISGVTVGTPKQKVDAYPGSGAYQTPAPAETPAPSAAAAASPVPAVAASPAPDDNTDASPAPAASPDTDKAP